jgi:hypothetical protein
VPESQLTAGYKLLEEYLMQIAIPSPQKTSNPKIRCRNIKNKLLVYSPNLCICLGEEKKERKKEKIVVVVLYGHTD